MRRVGLAALEVGRGLAGGGSRREWRRSLASESGSGGGGGGGGVEKPGKSLLQRLADSVSAELEKDKALKEQLSRLKSERASMENTDALKQAREKYKKVELETVKQSQVIKERLDDLMGQMRKVVDEASKSEMGRKTLETSREIADSVGKAAAAAGDTAVAKTVATGMKTVKTEIDEVTAAKMYQRPETLLTRAHFSSSSGARRRAVEPDNESSEVVMHTESKWYAGIKNWYEASPAVKKMMDMKMEYDESESRLVRVARFFTDGIQSAMQNTTGTDVSEVLTEIQKVDPDFDRDKFVDFVTSVLIPNVMEAQVRGDVAVLADWCHEVPFRQLSVPIQQQKEIGYDASDSRILDISRVELMTGRMMDQGPVFIISFSAHVVSVLRNREGKVIEGDPDKVLKLTHIWALCRDMSELDPNAAWKVLECHFSPAEMTV